MTNLRSTTCSMRRRQSSGRGFALLEALIAILLVAIGVLGLVGLQSKMTHAQTGAKFRGDAAYLASELIGTMWGDTANLASYVTSSGSTCTYTRCSDWVNKVANALPSGVPAVTVNAGVVTITITWSVPNEGTHTYVTTTSVTAAS